jgi:hypothetical protein
MIRVLLPYHLRHLARVEDEIQLDIAAPVSLATVIDALELRYPMLRGTIRESSTLRRRPLVRFFACKEDLSHVSLQATLPASVTSGAEPLLIVGAIAGG